MKIKSPVEGAPQPDGGQPSTGPADTGKTSFSERMREAGAAGGPTGARSEAAAVAGALRAGTMSPAEALRELVVRAVDAQLGKGVSAAKRTEMIDAMTQL